MKELKDIMVIVQARLSSERVPRKMLRSFAGTTLTDICINKIKESDFIPLENFYLAVHEPELVEAGEKSGVNVYKRSEKSAKSEGTPLVDMYEWWDKLPFKYCVMVNACCPFLKTSTIEDFIKAYMKTESDGLFGVISKKNYYWDKSGKMITEWPEGQACMNTKVVGETLEAAHCLYAGKMEDIGQGIWMGDFIEPGAIELYTIDNEFEILDIDHEWQFGMCEILYKNTDK